MSNVGDDFFFFSGIPESLTSDTTATDSALKEQLQAVEMSSEGANLEGNESVGSDGLTFDCCCADWLSVNLI